MTSAPSKAAIVGCGQRGLKYALYALDHPELFQVVAICDPNVSRQEIFLKLFPQTLDISHVYDDWEKLAVNIDLVNELDIVVICTMDKMHKDPCVTFSNLKVALDALKSHELVFKIEESRLKGEVVHFYR